MATASLLATALLAAPLPARAADEPAAAAHFETGRRAFESGDYDAAVAEFLAAYDAKPHPDVLVNIATSYERVYRPSDARTWYERFLAESRPGSPLRPYAERRLRILRQLPGSIVVDATVAGARVVVTGDGRTLEGTTPARFDALPPGAYHVHVELADHLPVDSDVTLRPGDSHVESVQLAHRVAPLTVETDPAGARLFLDDRFAGTTPFSRDVDVGRRTLRIEHPDFPPLTRPIDLDKPLSLRVRIPKPAYSGRTELILAAMLYGGAIGAGITFAVGGDRVLTGDGLGILIPATIAGVGLGFLGAWALTSDRTPVGQSSVIIGSTFFGTTLATELALGLKLSPQYSVATALLGSGLGLGAGVLGAWLGHPSAGDAAIVNSGGLWGTVAGVLLTEAIGFPSSGHDEALGWLSLGGTGLGLVAGSLFAWKFEVDRAHLAIVDAGGLIGLGLGYGIGYAAGIDAPNSPGGSLCGLGTRCLSGARYALGGMTVGLLAAAILTRRFYKDDLARIPPTDALITRHDNHWRLGLPKVSVAIQPAPEGVDRRVVFDLAHGEF